MILQEHAVPHIHYVGLSRVTTIEGLHITNLCENKIAVSPDVQTEMKRLRNSGHLNLSVLPLYTANSIPLKICYLNARSLHRHIEDIRKDLNYSSTDVSIFSETRFTHSDHDSMYTIDGYSLFRNMMVSLLTLQDLLEVQLSTAGSNSFLIILIVLVGMVLR